MGTTNHRQHPKPDELRDPDVPSTSYTSSSTSSLSSSKKKWSNFLPILVGLVLIGEIAFLGRLDMAKNADLVNSWDDSFYFFTKTASSWPYEDAGSAHGTEFQTEDRCQAWLEKADAVPYSRDFKNDPVLVQGAEQEWKTCAVGCKFGFDFGKKPDAAFGIPQQPGVAGVLRSMESAQYYAENNLDMARRWEGIRCCNDDKPFIRCALDKVETLKRYKFSLAFENSNEEDYVTEKFFQSLVAGSVPVVIGAPNIQDFSPSPVALLHIKELKDVGPIAKRMKYLAENPTAYNESLRWKFEGPSDSFKALVDMAAVHSSCRLCIHLAMKIQEKDEMSPEFGKRPCKCTSGLNTIYHVYVRERGRFEMESIFLRSDNATLEALSSAVLAKFESRKHIPIWKPERPKTIKGGGKLTVYRVYPVGLTQRQALYTFGFKGDSDFRSYIESHPCPKFEVIFV